MKIKLTNGKVIVTRKPIGFTKRDIPGTTHHRRYLVYTLPGRSKETREVAVKEVQSVTAGVKL